MPCNDGSLVELIAAGQNPQFGPIGADGYNRRSFLPVPDNGNEPHRKVSACLLGRLGLVCIGRPSAFGDEFANAAAELSAPIGENQIGPVAIMRGFILAVDPAGEDSDFAVAEID